MFGFLNIYKPSGMTSHDVVAKLRRITKIKQIGHTGTLDPFAEGVLPICIGKATRLIEYLSDDKEYIATVQFGAETTTYDLEGEQVSVSDIKICQKDIEKFLKDFEGEIFQGHLVSYHPNMLCRYLHCLEKDLTLSKICSLTVVASHCMSGEVHRTGHVLFSGHLKLQFC